MNLPDLAHWQRHWRIALAVWEVGSAAQAAVQLHASPSAVGRAVQALEAYLQRPLFERHPQGMVATRDGSMLLPRIRRVFGHYEQAGAELVPWQGGAAGAAPVAALAFRHLRVLLALGRTGSETRAAEVLGISQPAVHQALAQAESRLKCRLFERSTRGLRATEAGLALERRLRLAMAEYRQAREDWDWAEGRRQARIVVGALPLSSGRLVPRAVEALLARYPDVEVTIVDGVYDTLLAGLRRAEVDMIVGALRQPAPASDIHQAVLFIDSLAVLARRGHAALGRPVVSLADLRDYAWVLPLPETPARQAFERAFQAAGASVPPAGLVSNSPAVLRALLLDSDRLALVSPALMSRELELGLVCRVPVPLEGTERAIGISWRRDQQPSEAQRALIALLQAESPGI